MANWIRIFGTTGQAPRVSALVEHLDGLGIEVTWEVMGDDKEWEQVSLQTATMPAPLMIERMPTDDSEIRDEVDPLIQWLETVDDVLDVDEIERALGGTRQLFIIGMPVGGQGTTNVEHLSNKLSQFLARQTQGIYQVAEAGFYDAEGRLLLEEN